MLWLWCRGSCNKTQRPTAGNVHCFAGRFYDIILKSTPCGTRTRNLRIRSPTPCPLGQGGWWLHCGYDISCIRTTWCTCSEHRSGGGGIIGIFGICGIIGIIGIVRIIRFVGCFLNYRNYWNFKHCRNYRNSELPELPESSQS